MKRAYWISLGALAGVFAVAIGCGGVSDADGLFNGGGTGNGGATGSATSGSHAGSTSGSGNTSGTSSASGGGMSSSSSTASSSTASSSTASSSTASSSTASSSSSSGGGTTLPCGAAMCPVNNMSACCWDNGKKTAQCVQGTPQTDNCNTAQQPGGFQSRIECQDGADCNGGVCCGHFQNSYYDNVVCKVACAKGDITLCDPAGPNKCPPQTQCKQSQALPQGYFICN